MTIEAESRELSLAEFVALRARIAKGGYRGLTEEERSDLLTRTKRKERRASELFVLLHARFVNKVLSQDKCRKRSMFTLDLEESMQEGRLAVLRALETYEPERGKFSTYLFWCLRSINRFENSGYPLIWIGTIAFSKGIRVGEGNAILPSRVVGLDDPISEDGQTPEEMIDSDEPDPGVLYEQCRTEARTLATLRDAMATLSERERTIVEMRWSKEDGATLEEVGNVFGLSRERIRRIEIDAFAKIRRYFRLAKVDPETRHSSFR